MAARACARSSWWPWSRGSSGQRPGPEWGEKPASRDRSRASAGSNTMWGAACRSLQLLDRSPCGRGFGFCTRVAAVHLRPANLLLCRRDGCTFREGDQQARCINGAADGWLHCARKTPTARTPPLRGLAAKNKCLADRNETRTEGKQSAHRRNFFDTSALLLGQIRQKGKSNVD